MRLRASQLVLALAAALAAIPPVQAQLFKCTTAGKVVYQDQPCDEKSTQSTVRGSLPPAAPETKDGAEEKKEASPDDKPMAPLTLAAIEVVVGFSICTERVPGFNEKNNGAYEAWKRRNEPQMEKMKNRQEGRWLMERLRVERTRPPDSFEDRCEAFGEQLRGSGPAGTAK